MMMRGLVLSGLMAVGAFAGPRWQATIGAPADGDHYTVTSLTQVVKPDSGDCGFNDLGAANMGWFRRENRHHDEYKDGRRVRSWDDTADVFLGCHEP